MELWPGRECERERRKKGILGSPAESGQAEGGSAVRRFGGSAGEGQERIGKRKEKGKKKERKKKEKDKRKNKEGKLVRVHFCAPPPLLPQGLGFGVGV